MGVEEGEEEEEEVPSTTDTPGSEASTLRSRTPPRDGEDRRVGYLQASPCLELQLEAEIAKQGGAGRSSAEEAARIYVEHCTAGEAYGHHLVRKAVELGDQLLLAAGDLEAAMDELRKARKEKLGEPLRGAIGEEVKECVTGDHYSYLTEMVEQGVPARREYPRRRVKADPYPSAVEHLEELYEKAWKDATWGILLMCSDETESTTKDLIECPQGRVPKQLPDRSLSKEGRPIHAMLVANAATHKFHHPPALQPRHRQVARKAIWWKHRHPGIPCTLAKLDVSRAFKWHDVRPEDAGDFGSALPGGPVGVEGRVKMIYGGMPFGWSGAPGEYMIFALAARSLHESYSPHQPEVNGPARFSSEWLMDDSVTVEPLVGTRPWQAVDCMGYAIRSVWGDDALNLSKQVEEGTPSATQIVWGLHMDMRAMTCRLPEPKALKMRYLLALPELQHGGREVRLRTARELRGLAQYAAIAMPHLRTELPVLDTMLSENLSRGGYVCPKTSRGTEDEIGQAWDAWDETLELLRVSFEVPYEGNFEATFDTVLTPRELLAVPGTEQRLRWVGGDATLEVIGTLDWKEKRFMREPARMMLSVLGTAPELCGEEVEVRIALAELVCIVGFAAAEGARWGGEVVAYATDNMNVRSWLATRKARTPMARHLLRILGMLEARYRFRTLAFYIRTYHNVTADWVSRESKAVVESELQSNGWIKVDPVEGWGDYLKDALEGVYRWPGDAGGHQVRGARAKKEIYRPVVAGGFCIEIANGGRPWAAAWQRIGGEELTWGDDQDGWVAKTWGPSRPWKDEAVKWVFCSLTEDGWYYGRRALFACVNKCGPDAVLVDMPHRGPKEDVMAKLKGAGYGVGAVKVRATDFGDAVAKVKVIVYAVRGAGERISWPAPRVTCMAPNGIDKVLQRRGCTKAQGWVEDTVEVMLSRRISTSGDRMLPWPAGHVRINGNEGKQLIYDVRGPALTPKRGKTIYVTDYGGEGKAVRSMSSEEEWIVNGGDYATLARMREAGAKDSDLKNEAVRCFPQTTAHHLIGWAERCGQDGTKVGVCYDQDREKADFTVAAWLRAWRGCPSGPRRQFEAEIAEKKVEAEMKEAPTYHVGGRRPGRARSAPPGGDVVPIALGRARERMTINANLKLSKDKEWLDAMAADAVMGKLSEGTRISYEVGWKQWRLWRSITGEDAYLKGETRAERKADEDELLRYTTYLASVMKRAEGTIRQRLFAIKMGHVVAGYEDPTLHRTRLWAALAGYKRWQPDTKRKYPVLPSMLRWIHQHLHGGAVEAKDACVVWAALMVAFFYLLRASEYLVQQNRSWSQRRVLKGKDVEGRKDNKACNNMSEAEELVIYLTGSKTDQYNQGTVRNHFKSGDPVLCPVLAMAAMQRAFPHRFQGAEAGEALFRFQDGAPVQREDIQGLIQLAAIADGQASSRYGSHSLRIGGATAIYLSTKDLDHVKRFGRWSSDSFHGYLWEAHERQKGLASSMAAAEGQLLAPRRTNAEETPSRRAGGGPEAEDKTSLGGRRACCDGYTMKKRTNAEVEKDMEIKELYREGKKVKGLGEKGTDPNMSRPQTPQKECLQLVFS